MSATFGIPSAFSSHAGPSSRRIESFVDRLHEAVGQWFYRLTTRSIRIAGIGGNGEISVRAADGCDLLELLAVEGFVIPR